MRILTLFARHGTITYPKALDELAAFYRLRLPSARHDIPVVDNALGASPHFQEDRCQVIGGSNRLWEFSAWDEGLAHIGQRVWDYDLVHLVTSAFRTLYKRYIDRFDESVLDRIAGRGAAVGHIDRYNEPVELFQIQSQAWIRSSFLFIPPAELAALGPLASVSERRELFSDDPDHPFQDGAPLSSNHRRYRRYDLTTVRRSAFSSARAIAWRSAFGCPRFVLILSARTFRGLDAPRRRLVTGRLGGPVIALGLSAPARSQPYQTITGGRGLSIRSRQRGGA